MLRDVKCFSSTNVTGCSYSSCVYSIVKAEFCFTIRIGCFTCTINTDCCTLDWVGSICDSNGYITLNRWECNLHQHTRHLQQRLQLHQTLHQLMLSMLFFQHCILLRIPYPLQDHKRYYQGQR